MSNDVSYVLKVTDEFSSTLRKFHSDTAQATNLAGKFGNTLSDTGKKGKFFTQNLIDLGKATGLFLGAQGLMSFGRSLFDTQVNMQGMTASLAAVLPKFDKTKTGAQLAAEEIDYLRDATNRLGISFEVALPSYMQFLAGSKENLATTRKSFEAFAGISRLYGLNSQQFGRVIYALGQMQNKNGVKLEELSGQLGDALPGALKLFAEAAGKTDQEFMKLISNGQIGAGLIKMTADLIQKKFGKDMVAAANTLGGRTAVLGNQWLFLKTVLSDQLAPAMSSSISSFISLTSAISSSFAAINNQSAFLKLSEDGQAFVTILRISIGLIKGLGEAMSGVTILGGAVWNGLKDIVKAGTIATYAATGGDKEVAVDAFRELGQQMMARYTENSKVDVNVNVGNAPVGTTVDVKKNASARPKVNVGNSVNYDGGTD